MSRMRFGKRWLDLSTTQVMGILNVTPDSFSDGGRYYRAQKISLDAVLLQAESMVLEGATILDVGGESTRPGAAAVTVSEELDRVIPVIERLHAELDVIISLDSSQPEVFREGVAAGAALINDVRALGLPGALDAAQAAQVPVCLMHMQGSPATMQQQPDYADVVDEVIDFLQQQAQRCEIAGLPREQIILDPGFGFGKTLAHNLRLLNQLPRLAALGYPVLSGTSRKSMIGTVTGRDVGARLSGSLASALLAAQSGAAIVRVHDVAETVDALKVWRAVSGVDQERAF